MIPEQIWDAIKWIGIISCIGWWLKHLIKDVINFLIEEGKPGGR